jgi:hypothetical protein
MSVPRENTLGQFHFTVTADVAHRNTRNLEANPCTCLNDIGLTLDQLDESSADIAAAKKANTHDGR